MISMGRITANKGKGTALPRTDSSIHSPKVGSGPFLCILGSLVWWKAKIDGFALKIGIYNGRRWCYKLQCHVLESKGWICKYSQGARYGVSCIWALLNKEMVGLFHLVSWERSCLKLVSWKGSCQKFVWSRVDILRASARLLFTLSATASLCRIQSWETVPSWFCVYNAVSHLRIWSHIAVVCPLGKVFECLKSTCTAFGLSLNVVKCKR